MAVHADPDIVSLAYASPASRATHRERVDLHLIQLVMVVVALLAFVLVVTLVAYHRVGPKARRRSGRETREPAALRQHSTQAGGLGAQCAPGRSFVVEWV